VTSAGRPSSRTLVVLQPGYLPWLGFFDQMRRADVFVYYDDVQFDKHGWRNRNRIKTPNGPLWLTVPVQHNGNTAPLRILDAKIDPTQRWARKHTRSIRQYYAQAPFLGRYLPELEELIERSWTHIVDLDLAVVSLLARWLSLAPAVYRSSELGIGGVRSERLINLCRHFGATRYLSGDAAQDYLDADCFAAEGVTVEWQNYRHPVYPQQHGEFVPYLSVIDLLLNCGDESPSILQQGSFQ
jgi:WbqC-like protein family